MDTQIDQIVNAGRHQQRRNRTLLGLLGAGILLVGAVFGSAATAKGWFKSGDENKAPIYVTADPKVNENVTLNGGFSGIAKAVTPAVVVINVSSRRSQQQQQFPFFFDPRDFFGDPDQDDESAPRRRPAPRQQPRTDRLLPIGTGSGVIVSPDGYILTNNHVVEGAEKIEVELADKRRFTAKSIGTDPRSDLAVIKIEGSGFPIVPIGDSGKAEVGDIVLAIGNPLGVGQTVTMGIISAKSRTTARGVDPTTAPYEDFLQTDASINQGNSGGALVNLRGELIGVPSQILSRTGGSIGIGFAIPANQARSVMDQLIKSGKVRRGKLGVTVASVTPEYAEQFNYKGTTGAFVQDVTKGDPADQAGVKPGDIITEFQGQRILESSQLRNLASQTAPGTPVKFKVWRDGAERELSAKLTEVDPVVAIKTANENSDATGASGILSGIKVENVSPENMRAMRLPENVRGVVVVEVEQDSNAAFWGLRRGILIEEVAKQPVTNVNDFNAALQKLGGKKSVMLRVRDSNGGRYVIVKAQE
ncbi:MAG: Do family serine endopeptidase [Blastocatellia bacterium]